MKKGRCMLCDGVIDNPYVVSVNEDLDIYVCARCLSILVEYDKISNGRIFA